VSQKYNFETPSVSILTKKQNLINVLKRQPWLLSIRHLEIAVDAGHDGRGTEALAEKWN
jgi:hypothetical protein